MLECIVTSKTRIKILLRFFLNPERNTYLRELSDELGESSNGVRVELNRLLDTQLITSFACGRTKRYRANTEHPLFPDLHNIVKKTLGIDKLLDDIVKRLGDVKIALISGDYARGIDSGIIDLILVGIINHEYLEKLVKKTEKRLGHRKIRCLCLSEEEYPMFESRLRQEQGLFEIYKKNVD